MIIQRPLTAVSGRPVTSLARCLQRAGEPVEEMAATANDGLPAPVEEVQGDVTYH
ncbi:hypothetical protein [Actinomadura sp. DC4]|uniref:hypothetical protein n=1 Tax=Actinomadura sp. DC4 TaxID=3055069 RepID=UPI0025B0D108|nr:hypothetical protein [Actinomadura sp. DC4]MDN3357354.1 hypothetical protein [Actinomadura sp. DC4]